MSDTSNEPQVGVVGDDEFVHCCPQSLLVCSNTDSHFRAGVAVNQIRGCQFACPRLGPKGKVGGQRIRCYAQAQARAFSLRVAPLVRVKVLFAVKNGVWPGAPYLVIVTVILALTLKRE